MPLFLGHDPRTKISYFCRMEIKAEVKQEKDVGPTVTTNQYPQSLQRRMPLPYEVV